ncbi:MAG: hypothetical protein ABSC37_01485 [Xanthobacteraceae bacterium]|jgi:hypothetical protein
MEDWAAFLWSPTVAAAIVAAAVSYLISRRSIYINSVTVERSKWIGELRANIANLSGQVLSINRNLIDDSAYSESPAFHQQAQEIHRLTSLISLQLNPFGKIDKNILRILSDFETLFENPTRFTWASTDYLLIAHTQWLLKSEWEKVKMEAASRAQKVKYQ